MTTELDRILPEWHFRERHATRVEASPDRVFAAVREVTLAEMGVFRVLAWLRGIRAPTDQAIIELATGAGWRVLADEPGRELVLGTIGQPWRLRGGDSPAGDFEGFDRPGYAQLAINWSLEGTTLSTETRVLLTDHASRRAFRRYWLVIRPFSALIRRVWLRAIERRAKRERGADLDRRYGVRHNRTGGRMARAKNRQTMNKVARERELRERRERKQERKEEKKRLAAEGEAGIVDEGGADPEQAADPEV